MALDIEMRRPSIIGYLKQNPSQECTIRIVNGKRSTRALEMRRFSVIVKKETVNHELYQNYEPESVMSICANDESSDVTQTGTQPFVFSSRLDRLDINTNEARHISAKSTNMKETTEFKEDAMKAIKD